MGTSAKQIEANRRNALVSTGPRTRAGKALSSGNSMRHGLLSKSVLIHGEDPDEFEAFCAQIQSELQPAGVVEETLVERIIASAWRLRRVATIEAGRLNVRHFQLAAKRASDSASMLNYMTERAPQAERSCRLKDRPYHQALELERNARAELESDALVLAGCFLEEAATISVLARYETTLDRALYRALHELQRLQAAKNGQPVAVPLAVDVDVSG